MAQITRATPKRGCGAKKMREITIVVPTRNRYKKLMRFYKSVPSASYLDIIFAVDADNVTIRRLTSGSPYRRDPVYGVIIGERHLGSVAMRNLASPMAHDGLLCATDDITFRPDTFPNILTLFNEKFPDDDGVLGLQQGGKHHPSGVCLMGQKFLERYPKKHPYCPEYYHFACQEILWLAAKLDKWASTEKVYVDHHNPKADPSAMDQTHKDARKYRKRDEMIKKERRAKGLVWGLN